MDAFSLPTSIEFDSHRLKDLLKKWTSTDPQVSTLFLAMNILDFTSRLTRHIESDLELTQEEKDLALPILTEAKSIISGDSSICEQVCIHLSFDEFHTNLNNTMEDYETGKIHEEEWDDIGFDLADHFFSTELVIDALVNFSVVPSELSSRIKEFRSAFANAVDGCLPLAEETRQYAETAPGGPDMAPWPELLDSAPDPVFDELFRASTVEKIDQRNDTLMVFNIDKTAADARAASAVEQVVPDKWEQLIQTHDINLGVSQYNDELVIEILMENDEFTCDLDIVIDNILFDIDGVISEKLNKVQYSLGSVKDLKNKTVEIIVPGMDIPPIHFQIK